MGRKPRPHGPLRRDLSRLGRLALAGGLGLAGCTASLPPCPSGLAGADTVGLVDRGWHMEIALAAADLTGGLSAFRRIFPGARAVAFGYGKRTFFTAATDTPSEYLLGPFPGPAAIQATGLAADPAAAYDPGAVALMRLPPGGGARIAAFIWADIARKAGGGPRLIGPGPFPGSLFYAAGSGYSLAHTCNTWVAEALQAGGLPVSPSGAVLSSQIMARAGRGGACAIRP